MKLLFMVAHPDDESVAAGGAIRLLVDRGHEVRVVLATAGQAGEVGEEVKERVVKLGSVAALRREETAKAAGILGVSSLAFLDFVDGQITNEQVWGALTEACVKEIETYKPDVVMSFDHTGWYYHLDHIGVSLAVTRAVQRATHKIAVYMLNLFHPPRMREKWSYVYQDVLPATHAVDIRAVLKQKIAAIEAHASQAISLVEDLREGRLNKEYYQVIAATKEGEAKLSETGIFEKVAGLVIG